ncbi:hypothetical protein P691DRAFT_789329 [Macrolepiota fuliginosa MF-IS2]|uniref:Uncharacterized protein n=1 Tax=Macrolepiota fuliginosa MF-IS2 TaxID=1400762 RepID=A0A9P5X0I7_9AGAR|nr:hypothetical protein P691DRAFT_789329 [Macrolepiota fuliginosa MF-IS2]
MACKAKSKPASNAPPPFQLSATTEQFLTAMNQNCHIASQFTAEEILCIDCPHFEEILMNLLNMNFTKVNKPTLNTSATIEVDDNEDVLSYNELSPTEELTNSIAAFGQWFESNNIPDDQCTSLVNNIRHLTMIEAALQTPAPSHKATTPPPSTVVATLPAAAASNPPASPHGHASYAGTAARNLNPAAPPFVHGPPCAPVQPPAQAQQPVSSKCSKQLFFATRGPSQCQFYIEVLSIPTNTSLPTMVNMANKALACAKSTLKVDSALFSPCGITCVTATVPFTLDLDIIKATLSGGLLRIIDVPFFKSGTTDPFSSAEVDAQLQHSIIPSDFVVHWRYVCNSPKADSATIWINLSDSQ